MKLKELIIEGIEELQQELVDIEKSIAGIQQHANFVAKHRWDPNVSVTKRKAAEAFLERLRNQQDNLRSKERLITQTIKNERKRTAEVEIQKEKNTPTVTIPEKNVPTEIKFCRSSITNPYFSRPTATSVSRYAGNPEGYDWGHQSVNYHVIKTALKRNGLKLSVIYAGREKYQSYTTLAFIATTPNNEVVWYKYDSGPGSGQNHIYIKCKKYKVTEFIGLSSAEQDALLK